MYQSSLIIIIIIISFIKHQCVEGLESRQRVKFHVCLSVDVYRRVVRALQQSRAAVLDLQDLQKCSVRHTEVGGWRLTVVWW